MRNIHDRYIITDKVVIVLSGGINYLLDISKDFTYVVRKKWGKGNNMAIIMYPVKRTNKKII